MKLTSRFTVVFILYALALLIGVGLLAYNSGRAALRSATIAELEATALRKEENFSRWLGGKQDLLYALTTDPIVIEQVNTLINAAPDSTEYKSAQAALVASLQPRLLPNEFLEVSLLLPETGQVIASTSSDQVGTSRADQGYFQNG